MPASSIQRSFAGGEIAPEVWGRADQAKYQTGLAICQNFIVQRFGTITNRAGTTYIGTCAKWSTLKASRLIPYVYSQTNTAVLEFSEQVLRIIANGAYVQASPTVWNSGTAYTYGDTVSQAGVYYYCILAHTNQTPPNTTYWKAMTGTLLEIPTPYLSADLPALQSAHSPGVINLVHQSYAPQDLRYAGVKWTVQPTQFVPGIAAPTNLAATGTAGAVVSLYKVTATAPTTNEESLPGLGATKTVTAITLGTTITVTSAAHGFAAGDEVGFTALAGTTQLNGVYATIANVTTNTFDLVGLDGTGFTAFVNDGNGKVARTFVSVTLAAPSTGTPITVTWNAVAGAVTYSVYRAINGVYGFIGLAQGTSFSDTGIVPATSLDVPGYRNPFVGAGNYPGAVCYYQQRLILANSVNKPQSTWTSRTGAFNNFTVSYPSQDDDAITYDLVEDQVAPVVRMFQIGTLLQMTAASEWSIAGDSSGSLRPTAINAQRQGGNGCANLPPVLISNTAIYVQARQSILRDLRYDFQTSGYNGKDLTTYAPHLFAGTTIVAMAFAQYPFSVVWCVRSDGVLLGLTYVRDHDIWAWHQHVTQGLVKDVCVVPEGAEDATYLIVERTVLGVPQRYIERMNTRTVTDIRYDAHFVDCGITTGAWNSSTATMTLTGGTTWDYTETLTLTCSTGIFGGGLIAGQTIIGNGIQILAPDGTQYFLTITGYTSSTVVSVTPDRIIGANLRGVPVTGWAYARKVINGLSHLEGLTVAILADGSVLPQQVVSGGQVTLDQPYAVVHVGLPYTSRAQTLDLENPQGETLTDKVRVVTRVTLNIKDTRGLWAGSNPDNLKEQREAKPPVQRAWNQALGLFSGTIDIQMDSRYSRTGRVTIEQRDPLPCTILSVVPRVEIGGT